MKVYIFSLVFIIFSRLFVSSLKSSHSKKIVILLSLSPIFFMLSLKSSFVGADTKNYNLMYLSAEQKMLNYEYQRLEIGYKLFLNLIASLLHNPQWQHFFVACIIVVSLGMLTYRYTIQPTYALIFYLTLGLFSFNLTGIRQSIAMAITVISIKYIEEKNFFKFIIAIGIGMLFHNSAIFFLPAYFIANRKIITFNVLENIVVASVIFIFGEPLMLKFSNLFEIKYGIEKAGGGVVFFSIVTLVTILSLIYKNRLLLVNPNNIIFINLNFIANILWGLRLISRTAERPSLYYLYATVVVLEQILVSIESKDERRIITLCAIVLSIALFIYRLSGSQIYPYSFFWE